MALLDDAIESSGTLTRWNALNRFTLQLSIDGNLLSSANPSARFKDIVAEGCLRNPLVRLTGFTRPGQSGVYQPDRVTIENPPGHVLRTWDRPHQQVLHLAKGAFHDELHFVFLFGLSVWNYLTTPFILTHPGVKIEELAPWHEQDQQWRRLRAVFPEILRTHSHEQTFYFDAAGLPRRTDHDLFGIRVADYSWAHQEFGGIVIPTLRRALTLQPDGTVIAKPVLLDVEIFDAAFE